MKHALRLLLLLAATASAATAQSVAPEPGPKGAADGAAPTESRDNAGVLMAARPEPVPTQASSSDRENRAVSPGLAAALADGMPKFSPPTPTPAVTGEPEDLRDVDKPKNDIPRLPKYVVRELRPPVFKQRDLYTDAGLVNLALKFHPGLRLGNFFGLNEAYAKEMIYEDERLANIQDLNETAYAFARGGDKAEADYIQKATQDTFMRSDDSWNTGPAGTLLGGIGK